MDYKYINVYGKVTNESPVFDIISESTVGNMYLYIDRVNFSVYEAAQGGGGICQLKDTDGNVIYTFNTDGVKDIFLELNINGLSLNQSKGLSFIVLGAQKKQASVSIMFSGHLRFR